MARVQVFTGDLFDGRGVAQLGARRSGGEALLPAVGEFVFKHHGQPFAMAECGGGRVGFQCIESGGTAVQPEVMEGFQSGMR